MTSLLKTTDRLVVGRSVGDRQAAHSYEVTSVTNQPSHSDSEETLLQIRELLVGKLYELFDGH